MDDNIYRRWVLFNVNLKRFINEYSAIFLVATMSETLRKRWNSGPSTRSSKKKKYMCKYQDDWAKAHQWLQASSLGDEMAYCKLCSSNFSVDTVDCMMSRVILKHLYINTTKFPFCPSWIKPVVWCLSAMLTLRGFFLCWKKNLTWDQNLIMILLLLGLC